MIRIRKFVVRIRGSRSVFYSYQNVTDPSTTLQRTVASLPLGKTSRIEKLRDFLQDFSSSAPCLVSRSVVQLLYTPLQSLSSPSSSGYPSSSPTPAPALQLQEVLREACRSFIVPPALLPPPLRSPGQAPSPLHTLQVSSFFEYPIFLIIF